MIENRKAEAVGTPESKRKDPGYFAVPIGKRRQTGLTRKQRLRAARQSNELRRWGDVPRVVGSDQE